MAELCAFRSHLSHRQRSASLGGGGSLHLSECDPEPFEMVKNAHLAHLGPRLNHLTIPIERLSPCFGLFGSQNGQIRAQNGPQMLSSRPDLGPFGVMNRAIFGYFRSVFARLPPQGAWLCPVGRLRRQKWLNSRVKMASFQSKRVMKHLSPKSDAGLFGMVKEAHLDNCGPVLNPLPPFAQHNE